jgi:hypothetical protein
MSTIDSARRYEALDHVSQALALLERVQIRWWRYADTTPLANDAVPIEIILRTAKNTLTRPSDAHLAEAARMLPAVIMALQKIRRDELRAVIEKTQAALETLLDRQ